MGTRCSGDGSMDDMILDTVRLYLGGDIDFDSLEDRVVPAAFRVGVGCPHHGLVYDVLAEIAYVKDRIADETLFRTRLSALASSQLTDNGRAEAESDPLTPETPAPGDTPETPAPAQTSPAA